MFSGDFVQCTVDAVEALTARAAVAAIRACAAAKRIPPEEIARTAAPSLCHSHLPCAEIRPECAYCVRAGNCFAK